LESPDLYYVRFSTFLRDTEGNFEGHRIDIGTLSLSENARAMRHGNSELSSYMESAGICWVELIRVRNGARAYET